MSDNKLVAEPRTQFGKGAARKIRRDNKIPAVMYGHGTEPVHITLPGHQSMLALKQSNALLTIVLDGEEQLALAKDVQRDPIKPVIEHVDLVIVRRGEKVVVDVTVHLEGEAAAETVVTTDHTSLQLEVEATHIPESITVSVEGLEAGTQVLAGQVELPEGATLVTDPEALVVNVTAAGLARRPSRPSCPRPRPRPASSARSPTRTPPPRRPPPRRHPRATRTPGAAPPPTTPEHLPHHQGSGPGPHGPGPDPSARPSAYWTGDRHRTLARRRAGQPRPGLRGQPPQRRRDGRRRARAPVRVGRCARTRPARTRRRCVSAPGRGACPAPRRSSPCRRRT